MSTQTTTASTSRTETITPPRTRWAAVIWGLLLAAVAATALWLVVDDTRRAGISDWVLTLTPGTISGLLVLTTGVLLLAAGAAGLLRRVQRRMNTGGERHPIGDLPAE